MLQKVTQKQSTESQCLDVRLRTFNFKINIIRLLNFSDGKMSARLQKIWVT